MNNPPILFYIEKLRIELNNLSKNNKIQDKEILEISRKLDDLINYYYKKKNS